MAEPAQAGIHEKIVDGLRERAEATLDEALGDRSDVVIPDGPNNPNCGDCAIFLGLHDYLERSPRRTLCFVGEWTTPRRTLRKALPGDAVLLLNGGNGFGDVWAEDQRLREEIIAEFPTHRIVLAPQSVHFSRRENLERARRVLESHPNLTLLCRDRDSYELARDSVDARSELCPDAAFLLGSQRRPVAPSMDLLWLARSDHEALPRSSPGHAYLPAGVEVSDWSSDFPVAAYRRREAMRARALSAALHVLAPRPQIRLWGDRVIAPLYPQLARSRFVRGLNYLSRARVVITDRLHAHVLCTLMQIPHVVLPSADGKIEALLSTWTEPCGLARRSETAAEAPEQAARLVAKGV